MELRISQARATKDMDLTCYKRVIDPKDPISELIMQELQALAKINLDDHFIYQIGQPQIDIENAPYDGSRHKVIVFIANRPFVEFNLDVGGDFLIDPLEKILGTNWLGFCQIAPPIISMISIEQQFAEKLHSYTLHREQINTRTKDLVDLLLILELKNRGPESFRHTIHKVFRARNTHSLPTTLPEPPLSWQKPFAEMATNCGIPQNLNEGFNRVLLFYKTLLSL